MNDIRDTKAGECELVNRAKTGHQNDFKRQAKNGESDHFKGVHHFVSFGAISRMPRALW